MNKKVKWLCSVIGLFIMISIILAVSFKEKILIGAGKFMAPESSLTEGMADVVILEGTGTIGKGVVAKGIELLSSGQAKHMAIVLHSIGKKSLALRLS